MRMPIIAVAGCLSLMSSVSALASVPGQAVMVASALVV
jgi:hypothetical protein